MFVHLASLRLFLQRRKQQGREKLNLAAGRGFRESADEMRALLTNQLPLSHLKTKRGALPGANWINATYCMHGVDRTHCGEVTP
jgi:hypothetical protein